MQSRGPYIFNKDSIHNVKYACAIVLCIVFHVLLLNSIFIRARKIKINNYNSIKQTNKQPFFREKSSNINEEDTFINLAEVLK